MEECLYTRGYTGAAAWAASATPTYVGRRRFQHGPLTRMVPVSRDIKYRSARPSESRKSGVFRINSFHVTRRYLSPRSIYRLYSRSGVVKSGASKAESAKAIVRKDVIGHRIRQGLE
jgi:hypothetical protein